MSGAAPRSKLALATSPATPPVTLVEQTLSSWGRSISVDPLLSGSQTDTTNPRRIPNSTDWGKKHQGPGTSGTNHTSARQSSKFRTVSLKQLHA